MEELENNGSPKASQDQPAAQAENPDAVPSSEPSAAETVKSTDSPVENKPVEVAAEPPIPVAPVETPKPPVSAQHSPG